MSDPASFSSSGFSTPASTPSCVSPSPTAAPPPPPPPPPPPSGGAPVKTQKTWDPVETDVTPTKKENPSPSQTGPGAFSYIPDNIATQMMKPGDKKPFSYTSGLTDEIKQRQAEKQQSIQKKNIQKPKDPDYTQSATYKFIHEGGEAPEPQRNFVDDYPNRDNFVDPLELKQQKRQDRYSNDDVPDRSDFVDPYEVSRRRNRRNTEQDDIPDRSDFVDPYELKQQQRKHHEHEYYPERGNFVDPYEVKQRQRQIEQEQMRQSNDEMTFSGLHGNTATASNIPSKAFAMLQRMTGSTDDIPPPQPRKKSVPTEDCRAATPPYEDEEEDEETKAAKWTDDNIKKSSYVPPSEPHRLDLSGQLNPKLANKVSKYKDDESLQKWRLEEERSRQENLTYVKAARKIRSTLSPENDPSAELKRARSRLGSRHSVKYEPKDTKIQNGTSEASNGAQSTQAYQSGNERVGNDEMQNSADEALLKVKEDGMKSKEKINHGDDIYTGDVDTDDNVMGENYNENDSEETFALPELKLLPNSSGESRLGKQYSRESETEISKARKRLGSRRSSCDDSDTYGSVGSDARVDSRLESGSEIDFYKMRNRLTSAEDREIHDKGKDLVEPTEVDIARAKLGTMRKVNRQIDTEPEPFSEMSPMAINLNSKLASKLDAMRQAEYSQEERLREEREQQDQISVVKRQDNETNVDSSPVLVQSRLTLRG
ncbi:unnamed protein product, partial [Owenia fusiformis]